MVAPVRRHVSTTLLFLHPLLLASTKAHPEGGLPPASCNVQYAGRFSKLQLHEKGIYGHHQLDCRCRRAAKSGRYPVAARRNCARMRRRNLLLSEAIILLSSCFLAGISGLTLPCTGALWRVQGKVET